MCHYLHYKIIDQKLKIQSLLYLLYIVLLHIYPSVIPSACYIILHPRAMNLMNLTKFNFVRLALRDPTIIIAFIIAGFFLKVQPKQIKSLK